MVTRGRGSSHTVRVCVPGATTVYESVYRILVVPDESGVPSIDDDVTAERVAKLGSLEALDAWLASRDARLETPGESGTRAGSRPGLRVPLPVPDDAWVTEACRAVARALDAFADDFLQRPYLHLSEQSLHAELFAVLTRAAPLDRTGLLAGVHPTRLVHKEWPETVPRQGPLGERIRGRFDLAVLSPEQLEAATVKEFLDGRIPAPVVVEVGLDDDLAHLSGDADKVAHSEIPAPFLLHLSRLPVTPAVAREEAQIAEALERPPVGCRTVFAHIDPSTGVKRIKHSGDAAVRTV